jgi:DegV family protein with EDD domain
MTVKIVTDSTSDLSPEIARRLGITIVPLFVHFGTTTYRDGIDLSPEDFYQKLTQSDVLPTTSTPPTGAFAEAYDKLAEETDEILVITLSSKFSATYQSAIQGRELRRNNSRVEVIDSEFSISALGLMCISAAKTASRGANLDEVIQLTNNNRQRVDVRVIFDTLEYLKRGGRIGSAQAFLGSLLKVNPILTIKDGFTEAVTRTRSRADAIDHLVDFVRGYSYIEEMAIEDAAAPDEVELLASKIDSLFPEDRIHRLKLSPVVGTHVGPHALAVSVIGDRHADAMTR